MSNIQINDPLNFLIFFRVLCFYLDNVYATQFHSNLLCQFYIFLFSTEISMFSCLKIALPLYSVSFLMPWVRFLFLLFHNCSYVLSYLAFCRIVPRFTSIVNTALSHACVRLRNPILLSDSREVIALTHLFSMELLLAQRSQRGAGSYIEHLISSNLCLHTAWTSCLSTSHLATIFLWPYDTHLNLHKLILSFSVYLKPCSIVYELQNWGFLLLLFVYCWIAPLSV